MFPFFEQPSWHFGPVTIHAFGVTVAAAIWVSMALMERRLATSSLDAALGRRLGGWMLVGGLLGAHLYSVLFYFPNELRSDPWLFLRVWEDISSLGGMIGGMLGAGLFFAARARELDARMRLAYLDVVAFVFPIGLAIGRFGCTLAHDHPGVVTTFPLAISLQSARAQAYIGQVYGAAGLALPSSAATMGFHDLGFYEFLFLSFIVVPAFWYLNRHRRAPGFYTGSVLGAVSPRAIRARFLARCGRPILPPHAGAVGGGACAGRTPDRARAPQSAIRSQRRGDSGDGVGVLGRTAVGGTGVALASRNCPTGYSWNNGKRESSEGRELTRMM